MDNHVQIYNGTAQAVGVLGYKIYVFGSVITPSRTNRIKADWRSAYHSREDARRLEDVRFNREKLPKVVDNIVARVGIKKR